MQIDWDQKAAGLDLLQIRDILRFTSRFTVGIGREAIAERILVIDGTEQRRNHFEIDLREYEQARNDALVRADTLLDALVAGGVMHMPNEEAMMLTRDGRHPGYDLTPSGFGLLRANKTKRITRKAADVAVALLRKAIIDINANPVLMHDVELVSIYGSYITDSIDLGDVDVAFQLRRRWLDEDDYERRKEAFAAVYTPPQNQIGVYNYQYRWNENVVKRMLRPKTCIQLTDMYHVKELGCARLDILPVERHVPAMPGHSLDRAEVRLIDDGGKARRQLDIKIDAGMAARVRRS